MVFLNASPRRDMHGSTGPAMSSNPGIIIEK
jgi:hypothetical protein